MDIVLATNTENPSLALKDVERYPDNSGYVCLLVVRSGWLSALYPFFFEAWSMTEFIDSLRELNRTLDGEAVLKPMWEEQFVRFVGDGSGHISVIGKLIQCGEQDQVVSFGFRTDQTCLSPLIADLTAATRS